jgi:hypothetical protein
MSITEHVTDMMVSGLSGKEKMDLILRLSDRLLSSLGPGDREELVMQLVPRMMEKVMAEMDGEKKAELVRSLMPRMMDLMTEAKQAPRAAQP